MKKVNWLFILFSFNSVCFHAQFNNVYLANDGYSTGSACIAENELSGKYLCPVFYGNMDGANLGFLDINQNGTLNQLIAYSNLDVPFYSGFRFSLIPTLDNGFIYALGIGGPIIIKLDSNFEVDWVVNEEAPDTHYFWGGTELPNGDLVLGLDIPNIPVNIMPMRRYSSEGELLFEFDIELNAGYTYPSSFLADDNYIYIAFNHISLTEFSRNYIVCYNPYSGEKIWELAQEENSEVLGYADPIIYWANEGGLNLVYSEIIDLIATVYDSGYFNYSKIATLSTETGTVIDDYSISGLESTTYLMDAVATDDGGTIVLSGGRDVETGEIWSPRVAKLNSEFETEWIYNYLPPPPYNTPDGEEALYDVDVTIDDGIIAGGSCLGVLPGEEDAYQLPWVLKLDACGNEMVSDCSLSGVDKDMNKTNMNIYPNPATDRIFLRADEAITRAIIFDLQGRKVYEEIFSGSMEQTLFIDDLTSGLYVVHASTTGGQNLSRRVLIK